MIVSMAERSSFCLSSCIWYCSISYDVFSTQLRIECIASLLLHQGEDRCPSYVFHCTPFLPCSQDNLEAFSGDHFFPCFLLSMSLMLSAMSLLASAFSTMTGKKRGSGFLTIGLRQSSSAFRSGIYTTSMPKQGLLRMQWWQAKDHVSNQTPSDGFGEYP